MHNQLPPTTMHCKSDFIYLFIHSVTLSLCVQYIITLSETKKGLTMSKLYPIHSFHISYFCNILYDWAVAARLHAKLAYFQNKNLHTHAHTNIWKENNDIVNYLEITGKNPDKMLSRADFFPVVSTLQLLISLSLSVFWLCNNIVIYVEGLHNFVWRTLLLQNVCQFFCYFVSEEWRNTNILIFKSFHDAKKWSMFKSNHFLFLVQHKTSSDQIRYTHEPSLSDRK